ncbi:integral peroxisomal membrane peroxin-domain-containing protein [Crepidotus variabilis]|uniref:Integral peroxisomal membrane peroxin-domain-containing protein n=1 Tax=Crepidotus variabilis TaxID=179855 RepID=A0A9P6JQ69_9AGAR|nr:integral peroxisomal membrane peroxin-domain-containing protein [Crepidotus variabilis]
MTAESFHITNFLNSVPAPLTVALLRLYPCISLIKRVIQISTWSATSWQHSWLLLAGWWAVCLFLDTTLRNDLSEKTILTEQTLQNVVTDLTIIQSSLPTTIPLPTLEAATCLRIAFVVYLPYTLLTFFVSFRVICALVGTVLLTWRAPWAIVLRATVWRSAWVRWSIYKLWAAIAGQPLPPPTLSPQPTLSSTEAVQSLRFLFTIHENQRWWMGLDWTAALLPGERPSWCSSSQQPMSPPDAFNLPDSTTVYLSDGKGGRLKRTATWKWEEPEWRVLVHKEGSQISRVERPIPTINENANSSRLLKAAGRLREGSIDTKPADDHTSEDPQEPVDEETLTDGDGWVYGDNKWESPSNKGGMGKYTRYRRWTRIAIVFEIVEPVSPGDIGIEKREIATTPKLQTVNTQPVAYHPEGILMDSVPDSPLRKRLMNALSKPNQPP